MNSAQDLNTVLKISRIILGIFLVFVIAGSGFYSSIKFTEIYTILMSPHTAISTAMRVNEEEKETLLASVVPKNIDIEESEKLDMLTKLTLKQDVDIKSRVNVLDSLK